MAKQEPTSVKIGPHTYQIKYDSAQLAKLSTAKYESPGNLLGYTENLELTIYIEPSLAPTLKRETLIHEIWHAMFFVHHLDASKPDGENDEPEENFIQDITAPLLALIRENPQVFSWIYDSSEEG